MPDKFQNRFIQGMQIRGMRQVDIANHTGLPSAQISQYKTGKYEPMQAALYKIASALNVNVAWLMGYDVPMESDTQKDDESKERELAYSAVESYFGFHVLTLLKKYQELNDENKAILHVLVDALAKTQEKSHR